MQEGLLRINHKGSRSNVTKTTSAFCLRIWRFTTEPCLTDYCANRGEKFSAEICSSFRRDGTNPGASFSKIPKELQSQLSPTSSVSFFPHSSEVDRSTISPNGRFRCRPLSPLYAYIPRTYGGARSGRAALPAPKSAPLVACLGALLAELCPQRDHERGRNKLPRFWTLANGSVWACHVGRAVAFRV
jgi:hypothetical protein